MSRTVQNLASEKSILAKLLAQENITIQHLNVKTASFDVNSRVLTCPIWADMNSSIYDLLMGHEVGHALHTPNEGWHDALRASVNADSLESLRAVRGKDRATLIKYKGFLNVIEDARIEKLIKRKFPGLRKSFSQAYANLLERDFFGINKLNGDTSKLNLIDRMNLHFKCGSHVVIKFNDEERALVKEVADTETWDEVVSVTEKVWKYVNEKEQDKANSEEALQELIEQLKEAMKNGNPNESDDDGEDESSETNEVPVYEESEDSEDGDEENSIKATGKSSEQNEGDDEESDGDDETVAIENEKESDATGKAGQGASRGGQVTEPSTPESITDSAFRDKEDSLVDSKARPIIYLDLPDVDLKNIILPNKMLVSNYEIEMNGQFNSQKSSYTAASNKMIAQFHRNNSKYIALLVKEFEMRKNADQYSRQLVSKSGELDMRKLSRYRFTNDIFRKITETPKGKNHGMIMFLDMSGSMIHVIQNTIEQALVLSTFCKKVNIPFHIYGFSDRGLSFRIPVFKDKNNKFISKTPSAFSLYGGNFHLKSLISSDLSPRAYKSSMAMLLMFAQTSNSGIYYDGDKRVVVSNHHCNMDLGGTPFIETLVASKKIIKEFKINNHVDIVNAVYLTDGMGSEMVVAPQKIMEYLGSAGMDPNQTQFGVVDPETKERVLLNRANESFGMWQCAITELIRVATGCRHIGFYVGRKVDLKSYVNRLPRSEHSTSGVDFQDSISEHGFYMCKMMGYDAYFLIAMENAVCSENMIVDKNANTEQISAAFASSLKKKHSNRALCRSFASLISVKTGT